ncbi:MAG: hypothetical protein ABR936_10150 [Bacteroidota bacterium]|jgi:hypothetical protein
MTIRPDIAEFVADLEVFGKRKLNYPLEVGEILQIAVQTVLTNEFEELIFQAKFLVRTQDVMNQIGHEAEGFEKLSTEFQSAVKKSMDLVKMLVGRAATDVTQKYLSTFFVMETESFARLMKLYSDLSWIKNWQIDGKPLPYELQSSEKSAIQKNTNLQTMEKKQNNVSIKSLSRIQRSAVLAAILFVLIVLIDPPVTMLGWILSLGIAALLAYIVLQIVFLTRNKNSQ